ncbi:MAG: hypothetical protein PHH43_02455 [Candidatus Cloacimonetes bacterium]|nr:hypothetical protein [Candidatus Cloacimonadota bacterium]MDD3235167.1 hypothetical protein [Candidatus Cloacimonadota bacterium]
MKKIIFLFVLITCALGLYAQSGLFNLSYAMPFAEADSLLNAQGFFAKDSEKDLLRYFPKDNKLISAVIIFIEPKSQRIIGWFIKYDPSNEEKYDKLVIDSIMALHGEKNHFDEDTEQLIWFLSTTRTVHVVYALDGGLTVLYYDSFFHELFDLKKTESLTPEVKE